MLVWQKSPIVTVISYHPSFAEHPRTGEDLDDYMTIWVFEAVGKSWQKRMCPACALNVRMVDCCELESYQPADVARRCLWWFRGRVQCQHQAMAGCGKRRFREKELNRDCAFCQDISWNELNTVWSGTVWPDQFPQDVFDSDTPSEVEWPNNFKLRLCCLCSIRDEANKTDMVLICFDCHSSFEYFILIDNNESTCNCSLIPRWKK